MAIIYDANGMAGKVCRKCHQWKPVSKFNVYQKRGSPVGDGLQYWCKDCKNADRRAKRTANPDLYRQKAQAYIATRREQSNDYQRAWRAANAAKVKASLQAYREASRAKIAANARTRRNATIEHSRAIGRRSYANNREKRIAYNRTYFKARPGLKSAKVRARRNLKYQAEGSHTEAEWVALKAQYSYTCLRCGRQEPEITLTRDHVIPLTQGGSDWITNIQPLCHHCNSSKNANYIDYRANWLLEDESSSKTRVDQ